MDETTASALDKKTAIDTKVIMTAVNPCNGHVYTQYNAVLFSARDKCLIPALEAYLDACIREDADVIQIESVENLIDRVKDFQKDNGAKTPDIDSDCEASMVFQDNPPIF